MDARRFESSRKLSPASIRMLVRSVETSEQFPELPLASTQNLTMTLSLELFLVAGKGGEKQESLAKGERNVYN